MVALALALLIIQALGLQAPHCRALQCSFWDLITEGFGMSGAGHLDFQRIAEVLVWSQVGALAHVFRVSGTSSLKSLECLALGIWTFSALLRCWCGRSHR